jgi:hypothetical protein
MQRFSQGVPPPLYSAQTASSNQTINGDIILGFGTIFFFSSLILGAIVYKRYRTYRASTLKQEIEILERSWQLPSKSFQD